MNKKTGLTHEFVEFIPEVLEQGTLYISIPFCTAAHKCCCGCGEKVVTPLSPTDWSLTFDGRSISLHPSIGNWSFACGSHYWIMKSEVKWARAWSEEEIEAGRAKDRLAKAEYLGETTYQAEAKVAEPSRDADEVSRLTRMWQTLTSWFR
jgi:hypothetical protein